MTQNYSLYLLLLLLLHSCAHSAILAVQPVPGGGAYYFCIYCNPIPVNPGPIRPFHCQNSSQPANRRPVPPTKIFIPRDSTTVIRPHAFLHYFTSSGISNRDLFFATRPLTGLFHAVEFFLSFSFSFFPCQNPPPHCFPASGGRGRVDHIAKPRRLYQNSMSPQQHRLCPRTQ